MEDRLKSFGYGDKVWNNLDVLILDASKAASLQDEVNILRDILGAMAASGSTTFTEASLYMKLRGKFKIDYNPSTATYHLGSKYESE